MPVIYASLAAPIGAPPRPRCHGRTSVAPFTSDEPDRRSCDMAKRLKSAFACGHRGKGQWCHRCAQAAAARFESSYLRDEGKVEAATKLVAEAIRLEAV